MLGLGEFEFGERIARGKNNPIAIEYQLMFGKADKPMDFWNILKKIT